MADRRAGTALVTARLSPEERAAIGRLARAHDRTLSREVRRAIRFYVSNFVLVEQALGASDPQVDP
jgi:predicted transcriptional regulator